MWQDDGDSLSLAGNLKRKAEFIELSCGSTLVDRPGDGTPASAVAPGDFDATRTPPPSFQIKEIGEFCAVPTGEVDIPVKKLSGGRIPKRAKSDAGSASDVQKQRKVLTRGGLLSSAEKKATDSSPSTHDVVGMKVTADISTPKGSPSITVAGKRGPGRPKKLENSLK